MTAAERLVRHRPTKVRFTADEFMELCRHPPISEWVGKVELIEGEIVRMSPAHMPHWNMQRLTIMQLQSAFAPLGPEWVVGGEAPVRLGALTVRVPDVAVLRGADLTAATADRTALFMAVQIADSSLRNDLGRKLRAYATVGVPHYWVIDLKGRKVHVMAGPEASDYRLKREAPFGKPIEVPGAGATINVG